MTGPTITVDFPESTWDAVGQAIDGMIATTGELADAFAALAAYELVDAFAALVAYRPRGGQWGWRAHRRRAKRRAKAAKRRALMRGHRALCRWPLYHVAPYRGAMTVVVKPMSGGRLRAIGRLRGESITLLWMGRAR